MQSKANKSVELTQGMRVWSAVALACILAACSFSTGHRAPVEDRSKGATAPKPLEPVGPGYYRVKRGDTLYRIALEHGQSYRDIAVWNNLSNPNQIETDQVLRIAPPEGKGGAVVNTTPIKPAGVEGKPIDDKKTASTSKPSDANTANGSANSKPQAPADGSIALSWPAQGKVIAPFEEGKNKGMDIAGKAGDPILAAGEGKVIYADNSLRGYGNLIIVKHSETYLTAYAHNRTLLVKEGESVKKGQRIAEMGNSDSAGDRVKLHFEVRKNGKPVDPARYLPTM